MCGTYKLFDPVRGNDDYRRASRLDELLNKGYYKGKKIVWMDLPGMHIDRVDKVIGNFSDRIDFLAWVKGRNSGGSYNGEDCRCHFTVDVNRRKDSDGYDFPTRLQIGFTDSIKCDYGVAQGRD